MLVPVWRWTYTRDQIIILHSYQNHNYITLSPIIMFIAAVSLQSNKINHSFFTSAVDIIFKLNWRSTDWFKNSLLVRKNENTVVTIWTSIGKQVLLLAHILSRFFLPCWCTRLVSYWVISWVLPNTLMRSSLRQTWRGSSMSTASCPRRSSLHALTMKTTWWSREKNEGNGWKGTQQQRMEKDYVSVKAHG